MKILKSIVIILAITMVLAFKSQADSNTFSYHFADKDEAVSII